MDFRSRTGTADKFIDRMKEFYWQSEVLRRHQIHMQEYGYENHISQEMMGILRNRRSNTAKFVRYAPDFILCDERQEVLLEYKVTRTPRYTFRDLQWDRGQIEADALDNYLNLLQAGIEVIILLYCPYHSYPILCGRPDRAWIVNDRQRTYQSMGSGTEFYNIDLEAMTHFDVLMEEQFGIPRAESRPLIREMLAVTINDPELRTQHAQRSGYNDRAHETGFNWAGIN